jgi:hypothetical protein
MDNILTKEVETLNCLSPYFKKVAKAQGWKYLFEIVFHLKSLSRYRGFGKKTTQAIMSVLKENVSLEEWVVKLEKLSETISKKEIKHFSKLANSKEFRKLDSFFLKLHREGFSNRILLTTLKEEELGLLYKLGTWSMNTGVFLETFKKIQEKDRTRLLNYVNSIYALCQSAYREEILKNLTLP